MEKEYLLKLIDHVSASELTDFVYEEGEVKLKMKKEKKEITISEGAMSLPGIEKRSEEETVFEKGREMKSPLVGTFYRASSPDAEPFVKEGDLVKKGQVLGIIEAMKLMNEIECEYDGIVEKILIEDGSMAEYGQPLFLIR